MPRLACRVCGRRIDSLAPLEALPAEERRCPRCGSPLHVERRETERRHRVRRVNAPSDPGPPDGVERRVAERRSGQRRQSSPGA